MLLHDRFLARPGGRLVDVATGDQVRLCTRPPQPADRLRAWLDRCDRLMRLAPIDGPAALVDYGVDDAGRRFFVCLASARRRAAPSDAGGAAPVVAVPAPSALRLLDAVLQQFADLLASTRRWPPVAFALVGTDDRLRERAARLCLRLARLEGRVPLSTTWCADFLLAHQSQAERLLAPLVAGRHLLLVDRSGGANGGHAPSVAGFLLRVGASGSRQHLMLRLTSPAAARGARALPGGRAPLALVAEALIVRPCSWPEDDWRSVPASLAADSRLRGDDLAAQVVTRAGELASRGRHAAAERLLRGRAARAERREAFRDCSELGIALGALLLRRGRPAEAESRWLAASRDAERAGLVSVALRASVLAAHARIDAGRWNDARALLSAALLSAAEVGDRPGQLRADLALARCSAWQGDHAAADRHLARLDESPGGDEGLGEAGAYRGGTAGGHLLAQDTPAAAVALAPARLAAFVAGAEVDLEVARLCLQARLAAGRRDQAAALPAAKAAVGRAVQLGRPVEQAMAHRALAAVLGALGDVEAMAREVTAGLEAARRARAPLLACRLRLTFIEGLCAANRQVEAARAAARMLRAGALRLPAPLGERVRLIARAAARSSAPASSNPPASVADGAARAGTSQSQGRWVAESMVQVLDEVLGEGEDARALDTLTRLVRDKTLAESVSVWSQSGGAPVALAESGRRGCAPDAAGRAMETGLVVAPVPHAAIAEGAVPIRASGVVIGALVVRWVAHQPVDGDAVMALARAAASASAPSVRALVERREAVSGAGVERGLVGVSEAMVRLRDEIARAACAPFPVLIEGESGTGKELVARAIHRVGVRRARRFLAVNCAALSDDLFEAELFGHARGAFTGAIAERKGLFEEADGGTLVLDEVGELSPRAQAKLLRALQEGEVRRLGENVARPVDVRLVAASNRPMRAEVAAGRFRQDLLFRLEVVRIVVPPLRARVEDLPVLAQHFWAEATSRLGSRATLSAPAVAALARHDWPGNVRELQNVMASLAVSSPRRGSVGPAALTALLGVSGGEAASPSLDDARRSFERRFIRAALSRCGGHRGRAAAELGLSRQGFAKLLIRLGLGG